MLYNRAIVPQHVWTGRSETDVMGNNPNPVGSSARPYLLLTYDQTKVVWVKNDSWWGKTLLGLDVKPTYIIDQVNGSNNVALGQMLRGPDRPEQQLPARHQQHRQRHRRLRHPDLLREAALHAVGQHGLARDE